jgi:uncharacterized membrane protein YccC
MMRLNPGRPALALGVRTALATVAPLLLTPVIGRSFAQWASIGGFIVALADKGGSYRTRAATMGGVTLAAAAAAVLGALAAPHAAAAVPLMFVVATLCAFAGVFGPAAGAGGATVAVQFAVGLAIPPRSAEDALVRGLAFVAAGVWAMILALLFWPVRVYKPARYAVARVYRALAEHARQMARLSTQPHAEEWHERVTRAHNGLRETIEAAREVLAATRRGRLGESGRGARLLVLLQAADQMFAALVALEEVLDGSRAAAPAADALAGRMEPEGRLPPPSPLRFSPDDVRAAGDEHAAAIIGRLRAYIETAQETVSTLHDDGPPKLEGARTPSLLPLPTALEPEAPRLVERVRENLTFDSVLARHALRVGATAALAVALARALGLQRGYWVTLTVIVLMQPFAPATFVKALQRVAGTVGGAIVAALLLSTLRSSWELLVVATLLAGVSAAVLQLNYALFAFFLTPTFIVLAELDARDWHLAEVRIVNTLLGGLLALVASHVLWRRRERFVDVMARALEALADYVTAALAVLTERVPPPAPTLPPYRRALGLALNGAEAAFERLLADRAAPHRAEEPAMTLLLYARRVGATLGAVVTLRSLTASGAPVDLPPEAIDRFGTAVVAVLRDTAALLHEGRAPSPLPKFEALLAPFAGTLLGARLERLAQQLTVLQQAAVRGKEAVSGP